MEGSEPRAFHIRKILSSEVQGVMSMFLWSSDSSCHTLVITVADVVCKGMSTSAVLYKPPPTQALQVVRITRGQSVHLVLDQTTRWASEPQRVHCPVV